MPPPENLKNPDILVLPENKRGRDYIIGDVHGAFSDLKKVCSLLGENDRLFIVGDLIDRGENSEGVVNYIREINQKRSNEGKPPQIYVTRGNHENSFIHRIDEFKNNQPIHMNYMNDSGSNWAARKIHSEDQRDHKELYSIADYLLTLPHIIKVQSDPPFLIVHADMPFSDAELSNRIKDNNGLTNEEILHATKARRTVPKNWLRKDTREHETLAFGGHSQWGGVREKDKVMNLDVATCLHSFGFLVVNYTDSKCMLLNSQGVYCDLDDLMQDEPSAWHLSKSAMRKIARDTQQWLRYYRDHHLREAKKFLAKLENNRDQLEQAENYAEITAKTFRQYHGRLFAEANKKAELEVKPAGTKVEYPFLSLQLNYKHVANYVVKDILSYHDLKARVEIIERWVDVLRCSLKIKDYYTARAIYAGLQNPAIKRLRETFRYICTETKQFLRAFPQNFNKEHPEIVKQHNYVPLPNEIKQLFPLPQKKTPLAKIVVPPVEAKSQSEAKIVMKHDVIASPTPEKITTPPLRNDFLLYEISVMKDVDHQTKWQQMANHYNEEEEGFISRAGRFWEEGIANVLVAMAAFITIVGTFFLFKKLTPADEAKAKSAPPLPKVARAQPDKTPEQAKIHPPIIQPSPSQASCGSSGDPSLGRPFNRI